MDKNEHKIRRLQTDIKSAQGGMAMAMLLTLIYMIRAFISGNLNFYFSFYTVEFFMKYSDFFSEFKGTFPFAASAAVIVVFMILAIIFTVLSQKKPAFLFVCLALYGFDTVFMLVGKLSGFFSPLAQEDFIDIIVHGFILTFLVIGVIGYKKYRALGDIQTQDEDTQK